VTYSAAISCTVLAFGGTWRHLHDMEEEEPFLQVKKSYRQKKRNTILHLY